MLTNITNFTILCAAAHAVRLETTSQYLDTAVEVAMTLADGDNMVTEHEFELAFGAEFSKLYDAEDGLNGNGAVDNVAQWLSTNDAPTYLILRARAAVKKAVYEPASEALELFANSQGEIATNHPRARPPPGRRRLIFE